MNIGDQLRAKTAEHDRKALEKEDAKQLAIAQKAIDEFLEAASAAAERSGVRSHTVIRLFPKQYSRNTAFMGGNIHSTSGPLAISDVLGTAGNAVVRFIQENGMKATWKYTPDGYGDEETESYSILAEW